MKIYNILLFLILIILSNKVIAQKTICGTISNAETKKPISDVNIWVKNTVVGTTSDIDGNFCLTVNQNDTIKLVFSKVSFQQQSITINPNDNKNIKILLKPEAVQLTEVVVSSNKNQTSIQAQTTLPILISKATINESVAQNIPELLIRQPGISLVGTGYHTAPSIRGLARKRVVVMVDGEKVSSERNVGAPGTFINPFEIDKIEILKGPYSTLYGSDAVGGVVNIITKDFQYPYYSNYIGGRLDLSYKSVNQGKNANLAINGKANKLRYRISAGYRQANEYQTPDGNKLMNSFFTEKHAGAKIQYQINDNQQIKIKTSYSIGNPIGFPAFSKLVNAIHDVDNHFIVGAHYKIKNIGKHLQKIEVDLTRHAHELGADIIVHKQESNPANDKKIAMRKDLSNNDYIAQYNMYFRVNDKFKVLVGFDGYFRENIDVFTSKTVTNYQTGAFIIKMDELSLTNASQRSYGIFTQTDYAVNEKINLNAGIRWNYITTKQPQKPEEDKNNKAFSGNFGMSYTLTEKFNIKTNIGTAFRTPDIKELYVTTQTPGGMNIANPELVPEKSLNLDLAFVYNTKNSLIELSLFRNQINNMVILDWDYSTNPRTGTYQNVGKALLYGGELSYRQKISKNFSSNVNLTQIYGYDIIANDELMDVPPFQLNAGVNYHKKKLKLKLSGRYSAKQTQVAEDDIPTDAFYTFDFSGRYKILDNMNVNFSINNILNQSYREHYQFEWIKAPARSFNAGINYNF